MRVLIFLLFLFFLNFYFFFRTVPSDSAVEDGSVVTGGDGVVPDISLDSVVGGDDDDDELGELVIDESGTGSGAVVITAVDAAPDVVIRDPIMTRGRSGATSGSAERSATPCPSPSVGGPPNRGRPRNTRGRGYRSCPPMLQPTPPPCQSSQLFWRSNFKSRFH